MRVPLGEEKTLELPVEGASRWCYSGGEGHIAADQPLSQPGLLPSSTPTIIKNTCYSPLHKPSSLNRPNASKHHSWLLVICLPWSLFHSTSKGESLLQASCRVL